MSASAPTPRCPLCARPAIRAGAARVTTASFDFDDDFPAVAGAFNISGVNAASGGGVLEAALGLGSTGLDVSVSDVAFEGSAITQTFNVNAGDTLSFNYRFLTNEGSLLDYAFYTINGVKFNLAQVANATNPSSPFQFETGLLTGNHLFSASGSVTLGFGVVDIGDFSATSALDIDNVTITLPEPATLQLRALDGGVALNALAGWRYTLEASSNLNDWSRVAETLASKSGELELWDLRDAWLPAQFYRVVAVRP